MKNKRLLLGAGALAVLAVFAGWVFAGRGTEAETATAERGDIHQYVEEIGEVTSGDSMTVYLEGSGLIRSIAVEEGQKVKQGDLLLTMDREQLEIALKNAEESLKEAAALAAAGEEAYRTALKDYNNTKFLAEEGAVSQWELTQKEAALKSAEAVRSGNRALLEQAELNVGNSLLALSRQQVLSPIDGIVLEKNVELNEPGVPGTAAFVIGNPEKVEIKAKILADAAADISVGDKAEIIARTSERKVIAGTVTEIAPTATDEISSLGVKQKKVAVTIRPAAADPATVRLFKPGAEVDVKVITETKTGVIIVPAGAVFDYRGETYVFAVEGGRAALKTVKRGIGNGSFTEIVEGLEEGAIVLAAPDNDIEEGMKIKPAEK